jgi:arylformamidase
VFLANFAADVVLLPAPRRSSILTRQEQQMSIDLEAEYNNRARVPEHPEIFARWAREAAAYRARPGVKLDLSYGPSPRQIVDIFPAGGGDAPLALFIHGGWWRSLSPKDFSQMAAGPNAHGVTVAVAGYDLCPGVSISDIIVELRNACLFLWRKYRKRITVYGHSAGGHLSACMVATDWRTIAPNAPADLVSAGYAISGVYDLAPLTQISVNDDLRLTDKMAHDLSPLYWRVPAGRIFDAIVGADESSEFLRQSRIVAEAWRQGLAMTRYEALPGNHFTVIDPLSDGRSSMTARVVELASAVHAEDL